MKEPFRTLIEIGESPVKMGYQDPVLMLGSCFTEHIGHRLRAHKFPLVVNPFGVIYNPVSVLNSLENIIVNRRYTNHELEKNDGLWISFDHHGRFSHPDADQAISMINKELASAHMLLPASRFLFITFGTAWAYRRKKDGKIVANCHKRPSCEFDRLLLDAPGITGLWKAMLARLQKNHPGLKIIFTVSPVRHLKDGATGNQLSKARLICAIHELVAEHENTGYFPAYELMMDELRDYRFYADDMVHPSTLAQEHIFNRFCESYMENGTRDVMKKVDEIVKATNHRVMFPGSEGHKKYVQSIRRKINQLENEQPHLDFSAERKQLDQ